MRPDPPEDPLVEELVVDALDGYERILPPEVLARIRRSLTDALLFHPDGQRLVRQARPDPVMQQSGDVPKERDASSTVAATKGGKRTA